MPRLTTGRFLELGTFHPPGAPARPVRVFVPAGVDPEAPHATLYLFDGQNVFGDQGSYAGGWHAHTAAEKLGLRSTTRPVVVAIGNGGQHRIQELGRASEPFLRAVVEEIVPRAESVVHGRGRRAIGGSSLGGLAALQAWIDFPEVFDGALVMSPSLWFGDRALFRELTSGARALPPSGRLYVDAGLKERGRMHADASRLVERLASRGLDADRLLWRPDPHGGHHESHWRRRLPTALRFLFKKPPAVSLGTG